MRKMYQTGPIVAIATLSVTMAAGQSPATVTGGRLTVSALSGNANLKVEVRGATTRVFGVPGLADGTAYTGLTGVAVLTGAGSDQVELDVETAQSFDVRVDTGRGPANHLVKWKILPGAGTPAANLILSGDALAERKVSIEIDSESRNAAVTIDAGTASEVSAKVQSSNVSDFLRVGFTAFSPKTGLEVISAAAALEADIRGGGTATADELKYKIAQSRPAAVNLNWTLDTSAGDDKVEAIVSASGSTVTQRGRIQGRAGNDQILVESDAFGTSTGLSIEGGAGNDQLFQLVKGRFLPSQTLQTLMLGGDGDDELVLTTDTGIFGTGLPNDLFPIIDCGLGNDRFNAFGLIRGCEARL